MSDHKRLIACLIVVLGVSVALACGPDFPWQLLDDRKATLEATPANSFAFEAARLASPSDSLKAVETEPLFADPPPEKASPPEETAGLSLVQADAVRRMRAASNSDKAFEDGAGLPAVIRLYIAGAVAFRKVDLSQAVTRFQAVLELPEDERAARLTWATFMLGRSYALQGESEKAAQAYQQTRTLAINGVPDPLGLAVASYGQEAKLRFKQARSYITPNDELPPEHVNDYVRDIANAVALYAEQAARGSGSGIQSLRIVAEQLLYPPTRLSIVVSDPLIQRLLVTYVLAVLNDAPSQPYEPEVSLPSQSEKPNTKEADQSDESEAGEPRQADEPQTNAPPVKVPPNSLLTTLVGVIEQNGLDHPVGADHLAALAYRIGRYDFAAQLAAKASGPLAAWVKAKLATQKGDLTTAATLYAEAVKAFPSTDGANPLEERNLRLLAGEGGVLALTRGDYVDALAQLYPVASTYWGDVAYLAERVLTVNELQRFVDAHVPPQKVTKPKQESGSNKATTEAEPFWFAPDPAAQLRDLLARRLVREARYQEALPYFHAEEDRRFTDPEIRTHVSAYAKALREAGHNWWASDRAQGWFNAAVLARKFGMDMMGYETAPDFFANGGNFDFGYGQTTLPVSLATDEERKRFAASASQPDARFHYRSLAFQYSSRAADLLPPRSQAFAAVLCRAAGWANGTPEGTAIYQRYVQQGPYVSWAAHFGRDCPAPEFTAAARMARQQPFQAAHRVARSHRWSIIVGFAAFTVLIGATFVWFRRQRTETP